MHISQLISSLDQARVSGPLDGTVTAVTSDSRKVTPGSLFFAIRGAEADDHTFIPAALEKGALGIVAEADVPVDHRGLWIQVKDSRAALSAAACALKGNPSHRLQVMGVTGTNGKSTIAIIVQSLVAMNRGRCGLVGTIRYEVGAEEPLPAKRTTPDAVEMQDLLAQMVDNGCAGAALEVSSHSLHQHRVHGIEFDCAIFTNLTRDHLDYHKTMDAYYEAKALFPAHLAAQTVKKAPVFVVNLDDPYGKKMAEQFQGKVRTLTYGSGFGADYRFTDLQNTLQGTQFAMEHKGRTFLVRIPLLGRFNVYNSLAAIAAMHGMGYNLRETVANMAKIPQVPGRMQSVGRQRGFRVLVDYAHTPDALENALKTLKGLAPRRIVTVFGCGGNRDATKRPLMAAVAEQFSQSIILTSDNPRTEDPEAILKDIAGGLRGTVPAVAIVDRENAIAHAIQNARDGDVILIAGKGHEAEQIFADRTVAFDDVKIAAKHLKQRQQSEVYP